MTLKSVNLVVGSSCTTSPSATKSSSPPMASSASAMVPICTCAAASRGNVGASRLKPHASCVVDDAFQTPLLPLQAAPFAAPAHVRAQIRRQLREVWCSGTRESWSCCQRRRQSEPTGCLKEDVG